MMTLEEKNKARIENAYILWLSKRIGYTHNEKRYMTLMNVMYDTEFYYFVGNDVNRAEDGIALRITFANDYCKDRTKADEIVNDILAGPCSVLEMLVAFAEKIDFAVMWNEEDGDRSSLWFWTMMENLDLLQYSDDNIGINYFNDIREKLVTMMDRRYDYSGRGGLFPLSHPNMDQRHVEIWYQMQYFMKEHFKQDGVSCEKTCFGTR